MDHAIRIVASSVDFRLRTIDAPLNRWMQEDRGKQCWRLPIFWSGAELGDGIDKAARRFREILQEVKNPTLSHKTRQGWGTHTSFGKASRRGPLLHLR